MLNISFFIAAFASISWFFYSLRYLNIQNTTSEALFQGILIAFIPIALIWCVFAIIKNYYTERRTAHYIYSLIDVVKKNIDSTNALSASLIDAEKERQNSATLNYFNLLISDINEILSDIIKRSNSVSSAQLEHLWAQTSGGERWIMAKTFIEITNYQSYFSEHLLEKAQKDVLLKGSILEFYSRYRTIHNLLKNDNNKILLNMIEYGALGKVYEILTPMVEKLSSGISSSTKPIIKEPAATKEFKPFSSGEDSIEIPSFLSQSEDSAPSFSKTKETAEIQSFNNEPTLQMPQPENENIDSLQNEISQDIPPAPIISGFSQTQLALQDIKRNTEKNERPAPAPTPKPEKRKIPVISLEELEKEIEASPENNYDEYAYPFGAWLNAKNKK